jgi:hypothetical protein
MRSGGMAALYCTHMYRLAHENRLVFICFGKYNVWLLQSVSCDISVIDFILEWCLALHAF